MNKIIKLITWALGAFIVVTLVVHFLTLYLCASIDVVMSSEALMFPIMAGLVAAGFAGAKAYEE